MERKSSIYGLFLFMWNYKLWYKSEKEHLCKVNSSVKWLSKDGIIWGTAESVRDLKVQCFLSDNTVIFKETFTVPALISTRSKQINCEYLHLVPSKDESFWSHLCVRLWTTLIRTDKKVKFEVGNYKHTSVN